MRRQAAAMLGRQLLLLTQDGEIWEQPSSPALLLCQLSTLALEKPQGQGGGGKKLRLRQGFRNSQIVSVNVCVCVCVVFPIAVLRHAPPTPEPHPPPSSISLLYGKWVLILKQIDLEISSRI